MASDLDVSRPKDANALARLALVGFGLQIGLSLLLHCLHDLTTLTHITMALISALIMVVFGLDPDERAVWWRSGLLGQVAALGLSMSSHSNVDTFGWYLIFLSTFHFSEYLATAWTNPDNLSTDSFVINHSTQYHVAAVASWFEFAVELYYVPQLKSLRFISMVGVVLCLGGEILRKWAMYQAGTNFNHIVQSDKQDGHELVTSGIYSLVRHPSYVGWFYWSVGTQLILCNPCCFVAYTLASWSFFSQRIYVEEYSLLQFFGRDYHRYKKKVPSGILFISGFDQFTDAHFSE